MPTASTILCGVRYQGFFGTGFGGRSVVSAHSASATLVRDVRRHRLRGAECADAVAPHPAHRPARVDHPGGRRRGRGLGGGRSHRRRDELALFRMESALLSARDLADSAASSASELEQSSWSWATACASTSDALAATQEVSANVRGDPGTGRLHRPRRRPEAEPGGRRGVTGVRAGQPEHGRQHAASRPGRRCTRPSWRSRPCPSRSIRPSPTPPRRARSSTIRCGCGDWPSSPSRSPSSAGCGACAQNGRRVDSCSPRWARRRHRMPPPPRRVSQPKFWRSRSRMRPARVASSLCASAGTSSMTPMK